MIQMHQQTKHKLAVSPETMSAVCSMGEMCHTIRLGTTETTKALQANPEIPLSRLIAERNAIMKLLLDNLRMVMHVSR